MCQSYLRSRGRKIIMPHYNWRRPSSSSDESPTGLKRSSESSFESSSRRSASPVIKPRLSTSNPDRLSLITSTLQACPACDTPFDEANEAKQPRVLPCLHSYCTQCLLRVYDYLEVLHSTQSSLRSSRPASRYSWRRHQSPSRSSSPAPRSVLGQFICPQCHHPTPIYSGGRGEAIKSSFPVDHLAMAIIEPQDVIANNQKSQLLNLVVQEIQPKIRVIQKAVFETETAKQAIVDNVRIIEHRLMPPVPSDSEAVTRIRTELLEQLHKSRDRRLNAIVKRQVILKQCEKDLRFLYSILQKLNKVADNANITQQVFPNMARRLSDLGNLLEQASLSKHGEDDNSIDVLEAEIVSKGLPEKALAELSSPLYEKVVCNIPFLVMDKSRRLVSKDNLSKLSGGLTFKKDEIVPGKFVEAEVLGSINMEVVPPRSGLAEIDLKFGDQILQVRPSTAFIRPLSLDYNSMKRSNSKLQLISI